ncbi:hypothetical protein VYU27_010457, partial [Nannochloropsis oceanica]
MTVSVISEYSAAVLFTGTGELNVLGGAMILTGVNNMEAFALGATFGVGFEYTVGAGVLIQTGCPFNEYNGLLMFAVLGETTFLGSGVYIGTGNPSAEYLSQASENGQGGSLYIGAGYGSFTGVVLVEFVAIAAVFMLGEYIANDAGFISWIASPVIDANVFEFSRTLGEVLYVGAGAMVVWATPIIDFYGPRVSRVTEFFVMGTCESESGATGSLSSGAEGGEGRARALTTDRSLYTLPTFVAPVQGCMKLINLAFGYEGGNDGASSGGEEGRARALSDKRRGPAAVAASKARTSPGPKAPRTLM